MTYDTFLFFNEFELLELRLRELSGVVDRFVLVESPRTHSRQPKPLWFAENRARFQEFADRIIHVVVQDDPQVLATWEPRGRRRFAIEDHDRRSMSRGLTGCRPDDIILTGDVDEIPRASSLRRVIEGMKRGYRSDPAARLWSGFLRQPWLVRHGRSLFKRHHPRVTVLEQRMYYYFLNCACVNRPWWPGTRLAFFRDFTSGYDLRRWGGTRVPDAGWHFSFMGGVERIRAKIAAYAHQEYNRAEYTDPAELARRIGPGQDLFGDGTRLEWVDLDASFPGFVRENPDRFSAWLGPPAAQS